MSGGFFFPPPPPPPPKPSNLSTNTFGQNHQTARNIPNGRGRGSIHGGQRDRGSYTAHGNSNSSFNYQSGSTQSHWQSNGFQPSPPTPYARYQHQSDPGQAYEGAHGASTHSSYQRGGRAGHNASSSPPRTAAGHKRKLEALKPPHERISGPKPATAPAVPSFGAPLMTSKPQSIGTKTAVPQNHSAAKKTGRSLGLTPSANDAANIESDSEEDIGDEEALYAELGDKLTFEHNGVIMSLKSQADLVAWKKERQKNWPTQVRMAQKYEERKRIGEERRRLLYGAASLHPRSRNQASKDRQQAGNGDADRSPVDANERAQRLEELRKKVLESTTKNRETRTTTVSSEAKHDSLPTGAVDGHYGLIKKLVDYADDNVSGLGIDETAEVISQESERSSVASSDESSSTASSSEDSDDAPEEVTSKQPEQPPAKTGPMCKFFATYGRCRFGDGCKFKHEQSPDASKPQNQTQHGERPPRQLNTVSKPRGHTSHARKGIFQMLKEQEQADEDRLALQVVKYLGKAGFFNCADSIDEE